MTDPRRSNDERLSTADLAAAGERATQRGVDQTQPQRPAQAQPTPPGRPQTDREVMRDAQRAQRADVGTEGPSATPAPRVTADHAHDHDHPTPLFAGHETDEFRHRWNDIQTGFVDEPRQAVERADALVATAIKRLAEIFAQERGVLEQQWARGGDVSTEDLRVALRRYRGFFDRLLSV
jgi:hypothetical protein